MLTKAILKEFCQLEIQFPLVLGFDDAVTFVFKDQALVWDAGFLQGRCYDADIIRADGDITHTLDNEQASDDIFDEVYRRCIVILFRDLFGAAAK